MIQKTSNVAILLALYSLFFACNKNSADSAEPTQVTIEWPDAAPPPAMNDHSKPKPSPNAQDPKNSKPPLAN